MRWCRALLVTALFPAPACETRPAAVAAKPEVTARWHSLGEWSGSGNFQTESFDVTTGALRLRWETRDERAGGHGTFRVFLHSAISGRPLKTVVERDGPGAGTAYAEDDPRVSYLVVESAHLTWTVTLEEALPNIRSTAHRPGN